MRVLLTRPEPDATRTVVALQTRGHSVLVAPMLRTERIAAEFGGPYAAALLTSANAARALAGQRQMAEIVRLPAVTVGARSAEAARSAGFARVESADGALPDLVRHVAERFAGQPLLYLAGEDRAGDLPGELARYGIAVETVAVYRAVAAESLPAGVVLALEEGGLDAALHYSSRSAGTLLQLAAGAGVLNAVINLAHYCLSPEVAGVLRQAGAGRIHVATVPTEAALMALLDDD
jgi:uroporphyrinogen-III synthase